MAKAIERTERVALAEPDQGSARSQLHYGMYLHALTGLLKPSRAENLEVEERLQHVLPGLLKPSRAENREHEAEWVPSKAEVEKENSIA